MDNPRRWQEYDLVKLLISIVLAIIVILLLFVFDPGHQNTLPTPTRTPVEVTNTPTATISPGLISSTPATNIATPSQPSTATSTPPLDPTITPTYTASPTPTITPTPTSTATAPATQDSCSLAITSKLTVGQKARVLTSLNLRKSPGLDREIASVNEPGMVLDIIGGPVCTTYLDRAYRWWQVKNEDGVTGWSTEGSAIRFFYFLEPVK